MSGSHKHEIPNAECPECVNSLVIEAPEAGYAYCTNCGERGNRNGDTANWWRNDPDSWWYIED